MTPKNKPTDSLRSGTLNMRITPRLLYLAKIAARYQDISLSNFIENAITHALAPERVSADEPKVEMPTYAIPQMPLWGEGLWDEDEATRMFLLATGHPDLLNSAQAKLWTLLSGSIMRNHGKLTLKKFIEYYNSRSIDTKHLQLEEG